MADFSGFLSSVSRDPSSEGPGSLYYNYGADDLLKILLDVMAGRGGLLSSTVFSRPNQAYSYDVLADTRDKFASNIFKSIGRPTVDSIQHDRISTMAASMGLNVSPAIGVLKLADSFLGDVITGNYGASAAASKLLDFSSGMAVARGSQPGGVLNPSAMARNMRMAALEGGEAYKGLFNDDGSININQTHGLNLATSSFIIGKTLSDRSIREGWASKMRKGGDGLNVRDRNLSDLEIENLKNGVGMTDEALKSFGDYTKKFTEEINKFVASVSKMTGSYDEALNFMQKMTGGELFKDTDKAREARERAANIAINMRVAAANAGISAPELYATSNTFSKAAAMATGLDMSNVMRGGSDQFMNFGNLGATAIANWRAINPMASAEEISRTNLAAGDSISSYLASEQDQMNAFAARLKNEGYDMSDYEANLRSGNADVMKDILQRKVGKERFLSYMDNKGLAALDRIQFGGDYRKMAEESLIYGRSREVRRVGGDKLFEQAVEDLSSGITGGNDTEAYSLSKKIFDKYKENLLSDDALKEAGITDEFDRENLRKQAKGLTFYETQELLNNTYGADASDLANRKAMQMSKDEVIKIANSNTMTADEEEAAKNKLLNDSRSGLSEENRAKLKEEYEAGKFNETGLTGMLERARVISNKNFSDIKKYATGGKMLSSTANSLLKGFNATVDRLQPEITKEDINKAKIDIVRRNAELELDKTATKASKGDKSALDSLIGSGDNSILSKAIEGSEYELTGESYVKNLVTQAYGLDALPEKERNERLSKALKIRNKLVNEGKSSSEIRKAMDSELGIKGDFSEESLRAAYADTEDQNIAQSLVSGITEKLKVEAPSIDFKGRDITKDDISNIAENVQTARSDKANKGKSDRELFSDEVEKFYADKYSYLKDGTQEGEDKYNSVMGTVRKRMSEVTDKDIVNERLKTAQENIQITEEGASSKTGTVSDKEAKIRAIQLKEDADKNGTALKAAASGDLRSPQQVIAQYTKELNNPLEAWKKAHEDAGLEFKNTIVSSADEFSAKLQNKQFATQSSDAARQTVAAVNSVTDSDVDNLVNLDNSLREKFEEKFKNAKGTDAETEYNKFLENSSGDVASSAISALGISGNSQEAQEVQKSVEELTKKGYSSVGIKESLKSMHDDAEDAKYASHRKADAKEHLAVDKVRSTSGTSSSDPRIEQLIKILIDLLRGKL